MPRRRTPAPEPLDHVQGRLHPGTTSISPWLLAPNAEVERCMVSVAGYSAVAVVSRQELAQQATPAQEMALRATRLALVTRCITDALAQGGPYASPA